MVSSDVPRSKATILPSSIISWRLGHPISNAERNLTSKLMLSVMSVIAVKLLVRRLAAGYSNY